jgi:hypothetical protein
VKQVNDYLWKGVLEETLDDFLRLMHQNADEVFDFSKEIVFLDKELQQLFPAENKDELALKVVDKLAKVYLRDGREEWVLVHCEVQEKYNDDFPHRMFTYYMRILEKYGKPVSAYAIFTGSSVKPRSCEYVTEFLGTRLTYRYNVYQIALQNEQELHASNNPFAKIALVAYTADRRGKALTNDATQMQVKLNLLREFLKMQMPKRKSGQYSIF